MGEVSPGVSIAAAFATFLSWPASPCQGTAKIVLKGAYMFHYYIKLAGRAWGGREHERSGD